MITASEWGDVDSNAKALHAQIRKGELEAAKTEFQLLDPISLLCVEISDGSINEGDENLTGEEYKHKLNRLRSLLYLNYLIQFHNQIETINARAHIDTIRHRTKAPLSVATRLGSDFLQPETKSTGPKK